MRQSDIVRDENERHDSPGRRDAAIGGLRTPVNEDILCSSVQPVSDHTKSGSRLTRRWREMDSNPRSLVSVDAHAGALRHLCWQHVVFLRVLRAANRLRSPPPRETETSLGGRGPFAWG
jgi:hypothetical protein